MDIKRDQELDNLAENIGETLLHDCLKANKIGFQFKHLINLFININEFKTWLHHCNCFLPYMADKCLILQTQKSNVNDNYVYCYTYVVCNLDRLLPILQRTSKLKAFL